MTAQFLILLLTLPVQQNKDTVFAFRLGGTTILSHSPSTDLSHFQQFLDSCSGQSLSFTNLSLADVTGDGVSDSCLTAVSLVSGVPFIEHKIVSSGRTIWRDTLTLQSVFVSTLYWNDDSAFVHLMPYSGMFIAKTHFTNFVSTALDTNELHGSYFINVLHADHRTEWFNRYRLFKGHRIWDLDLSDRNEFIWDSRSQKFIHYSGN